MGHYDSSSRIYVGSDGSRITTVVIDVTPNYIKNLIGLEPAQ